MTEHLKALREIAEGVRLYGAPDPGLLASRIEARLDQLALAGAQAGVAWVDEAMRLAGAYAVACVDFETASVRDAIDRELRATMLGAEKKLRTHLTTMAAIPEAKEKP